MDNEIDDILNKAARNSPPVDPALLDKIAASLQPDLRPIRPMPSPAVLTSALSLICTVVALLGAARAGFAGFLKLSVPDRALIFACLAILIWTAAAAYVSEKIPGSRRIASPGVLLGSVCATLLAVFAFVFRDYHVTVFVSAGLRCLATGLLYAVPAALGCWFVLRRGYAVNPGAAGLLAGTLAGLAGVTMLELHCPKFEALHVMVWHILVVVVSGAVGAWLAGRAASRRVA